MLATAWTAEDLLAVGVEEPGRVFALDAETAHRQWRALSSQWHPDRNCDPQARWAFSHVQDLYRAAQEKREGGLWEEPGEITLTTLDRRTYRLRFRRKHTLDVGHVYMGREVIAYALDAEFSDLASHAYSVMRNLPFTDEHMRSEMARYLPQPIEFLETSAARVLVLRKPSTFIGLGDLLQYIGGELAPCHVAWIVSALLNLGCYLETAGLAHQAIDIDHLLISPEHHALALTGGWWYAAQQNTPLHALPSRSVRLAPPDVTNASRAVVRLDQFLLRATALELLGSELEQAPAAMRDFLMLPPAASLYDDYQQWQRTLWDSFGERRFVPLAVNPDDIYAMTP